MKKIILFIVFLLLVSIVHADGGFFKLRGKNNDEMILEQENNQFAMIDYQDGVESLLIAIEPESLENDSNYVWVFPIPGEPDQTDIDITLGFPTIRGDKLENNVKKSLESSFIIIYGINYISLLFPMAAYFGILSPGAFLPDQGVTVHKSVEKYGLTSELVSADGSDPLFEYISSKGAKPSEEYRSYFDYYLGQDYSFVITWVSSQNIVEMIKQFEQKEEDYRYRSEEKQKYELGVKILFPTEKIFYPLKLTSIYGQKIIPIRIYVLDYVTPEFDENIINFVDMDYYEENHYSTRMRSNSDQVIERLNNNEKLDYTLIDIKAPSSSFITDLWIDPKAPKKVIYQKKLKKFSWLIAIGIFFLVTCLSSALMGYFLFRKNEGFRLRKFLLLGFTNILTIIGFIAYS